MEDHSRSFDDTNGLVAEQLPSMDQRTALTHPASVWLRQQAGRWAQLDQRRKLAAALSLLVLPSIFLMSAQSGAAMPTYLLAVLAIVGYRDAGLQRLATPLGLVLVGLLLFLPATALWSDEVAVRKTVTSFSRSLFIVAYVLAFAKAWRDFFWFRQWLPRLVVPSAAGAALAAYAHFVATNPWDNRLAGLGLLGSHVFAGWAYAAASFWTLLLWREDRLWWRGVAIVSAVVLMCAVALTGSRGALAGGIAGWIVLMATVGQPTSRQFLERMLQASVALVCLAVVAGLVSESIREMLLSRGSSFRFEVWSLHLQELRGWAIVFGHGLLSDDQRTGLDRVFQHPHSVFVAVLVQGGVIALGLFGALLAATTWRLLHAALAPGSGATVARAHLAALVLAIVGIAFDGWELVDKVSALWLLVWQPVAAALLLGPAGRSGRERLP